MANNTTLASACGINDQFIIVTSATGALTGNLICIDSEFMAQSAAAVGTQIPVRRGGQLGSAQKAHVILAPVLFATSAEIPVAGPGSSTPISVPRKQIVTYSVTGAITPPTIDTLIMLDKATASAMTLASPAAGTPDGIEVTIYSNTAAAHTVTYTPGFNADTTSSDVATFAATKGNSMTILSSGGLWGMKCASGVTLA
jgi:hypothetical protein